MNVHEFLREKEYNYYSRSNIAIGTMLNATDASKKLFYGKAYKKYLEINEKYLDVIGLIKEIRATYIPTPEELVKICIDKKMNELKKNMYILKKTYRNYRSICNFSAKIQSFYIKKYQKISYTLKAIEQIKQEIEQIEKNEKQEKMERYKKINADEIPF